MSSLENYTQSVCEATMSALRNSREKKKTHTFNTTTTSIIFSFNVAVVFYVRCRYQTQPMSRITGVFQF